MTTISASSKLPFQLGEPRSFGGLTLVPLYSVRVPQVEYVGLDEASALGLAVSEVGAAGSVETLLVENPLGAHALLYDGEELIGAKQNRIVAQTILVSAKSTLKIPAKCVEQGRWAWRSERFQPAPHAAYPELRRVQREGQAATWDSVAGKSARLAAHSPTGAADAVYRSRASTLDEYLVALPRLDGQAGALVGIAGRLVCLDYVSRSEVFAGLYAKLLRGYALDAIESPVDRPHSRRDVGRFLGELELAVRSRRPAVGLGEEGELTEYALGTELALDGEVVALTAFPRKR
jgi:hypothetical protein